jgi:integrase
MQTIVKSQSYSEIGKRFKSGVVNEVTAKYASMVESVDTRDLKSLGGNPVPVQVWLEASKSLPHMSDKRIGGAGMEFPTDTRFRIIPPTGSHKVYRLQYSVDQGRKWKAYRTEEIDAINKMYRDRISTADSTVEKLKSVMAGLYAERDKKKPKTNIISDNARIMEAYLADRYSKRRTRKITKGSIDDARRSTVRVMQALGSVSIQGNIDDIDSALDSFTGGDDDKLRRLGMRCNSILKWLGRKESDRVILPDELSKGKVSHITEDQLRAILPHCKDHIEKVLYQIAFYSGMRIGEIFGLEAEDVNPKGSLYVRQQMTRDKQIKPGTKAGKSYFRTVAIDPEQIHLFEKWFSYTYEERAGVRNRRWYQWFQDACTKADVKNDVVFHSLRHSYAIWMLGNGFNLKRVADSLGNSQVVCERYYSGREMGDHDIDDTIRRLVEIRKKKSAS